MSDASDIEHLRHSLHKSLNVPKEYVVSDNSNWTTREDDILKKHYGVLQYKDILEYLPSYRTVSSVQNRISYLGIACNRGESKFSRTGNPRSAVNDKYFEKLNLGNCYWAGFIAADGCIKVGSVLKLKLSSRDLPHIEKFVKDIDFGGSIYDNSFVTKKGTPSFSSEISIRSKQICDDLLDSFNISQNKTKTYCPPKFRDTKLLDSFIVGYIDGDGCIGYYGSKLKQKYLNVIVVGTLDLCQLIRNRFQGILNDGFEISVLKEKGSSHLYRVTVSGKRAEKLYNHLKEVGCPKLKRKWDYHTKNWGYERWISNNKNYCGKLLFFNKGKRCSWHSHKIKSETFYLHSGKILLKHSYDNDISKSTEMILLPGSSFDVPVGLVHQMIALENSELFEFSTEHFDSDSYRIIKGD